MCNIFIQGQEAANSFVKIANEKGEESYANTSRIVPVTEEDVIGSNKRITYRIVEGIDGEENKVYAVGERKAGMVSSGGRDEERYKNPKYRVENVIALAKRVPDGADVRLVTGLPAKHYNDTEVIETVELALKGRYVVEISGKHRKSFEVTAVKTLLQPLGTLLYRLYDKTGRLREGRESEKGMRKLIIDIGYGTTDVAIIDGLSIEKATPVDVGMMDAYNMIDEAIISKYPKFSGIQNPLQLEERLRNSNVLTAGGVTYPENVIATIKQDAFKETANRIMSAIGNKNISLRDFDKVLFTGGGVTALAQDLKPYLEGVNASQMANAQLANAIGFYTYGVMKQGNF